jgi:hypothetical protein
VSGGEVFLRLGKFHVASGQRPVVGFNAGIERAIGQFDTFGGAFTIMGRPRQRVVHDAKPQFVVFLDEQNFRGLRSARKDGKAR